MRYRVCSNQRVNAGNGLVSYNATCFTGWDSQPRTVVVDLNPFQSFAEIRAEALIGHDAASENSVASAAGGNVESDKKSCSSDVFFV
jgi:hypothetical protein